MAALLAFTLGSGSGAALRSWTAPEPLVGATAVGPVRMVLPADLGPWEAVPTERLAILERSPALGLAVVEGTWGVVAPGGVLVTVVCAEAGTHGGLDAVVGPFDDRVDWRGRRAHLAGTRESGGIRELVLATELDDGRLVLLSVSGPEGAFASGTLQEAFRTAEVG